jgi:hypothetical protein
VKKVLATFALVVGLSSAVTGLAVGTPGPNGHNNHGLCTAYFNGSENGQQHKRKAPPFQGLEQAAADADQSVEEFCAGMVGGRAGK